MKTISGSSKKELKSCWIVHLKNLCEQTGLDPGTDWDFHDKSDPGQE
jgi:hypothetical protein